MNVVSDLVYREASPTPQMNWMSKRKILLSMIKERSDRRMH